MRQRVRFLWQDSGACAGFRTGVALHGHTMRSKECLSFLPRHLRRVPGVAPIVRHHEKRVDFARAYWTPPLSPAAADALERGQLAKLGLRPIVSLTDHDDIEAGLSLAVARWREEAPVSVEWTAPFQGSIFHFGIHNLPSRLEREWMTILAEHTAAPDARLLPEILRGLADAPETLIVLNHPFWLEEGVDEDTHARALPALLALCKTAIHAFELNGTRPWKENRDTISLAEAHERPVISGGDRHGCEPAACVNLTNARSFAEFAAEARAGESEVVFLPHYREPLTTRILGEIWDILRPYPEYPGRERWTDRVYYTCEDGQDRPLSALADSGTAAMLRCAARLIELAAATPLKSALRLALARTEIAL